MGGEAVGFNHLDDFDAQAVLVIPRLRRYARALTGGRLPADDLVQDTLERAWSKRHLWRQGSDLRAWMFSIMHNVYINQVRARVTETTVPLDQEAYAVPVRDGATDGLEVAAIDAALRQLPDDQREVLLLVALEQLSYVEAANALGIPIGTVMSRLSRARERLRVLLGSVPVMATGILKVVK